MGSGTNKRIRTRVWYRAEVSVRGNVMDVRRPCGGQGVNPRRGAPFISDTQKLRHVHRSSAHLQELGWSHGEWFDLVVDNKTELETCRMSERVSAANALVHALSELLFLAKREQLA